MGFGTFEDPLYDVTLLLKCPSQQVLAVISKMYLKVIFYWKISALNGSKGWFESRSSFLRALHRVLNSWNLPGNFPDLEKVWKIEVKSWKNGKKSWFFFGKLQQVLHKGFFFFMWVKSYSISPACHWKSFVPAFL